MKRKNILKPKLHILINVLLNLDFYVFIMF